MSDEQTGESPAAADSAGGPADPLAPAPEASNGTQTAASTAGDPVVATRDPDSSGTEPVTGTAAEPSAPPAAGGSTPAPAPQTEPAIIAKEEPELDAIEIEPEAVPPPKPGSHHPPPPPSIRIGTAARSLERLEVTGAPKLVQDLMTRKLFTIGPTDPIERLKEHMQSFRFRHLPVVENRKLVGLITHRDLLHVSSSFLSKSAKEEDAIILKLPASRIMQRELITVRPTDSLSEVSVLMWEAKIGCVLVTEADNTLVGIVTEADFLRLAHHFLQPTN